MFFLSGNLGIWGSKFSEIKRSQYNIIGNCPFYLTWIMFFKMCFRVKQYVFKTDIGHTR